MDNFQMILEKMGTMETNFNRRMDSTEENINQRMIVLEGNMKDFIVLCQQNCASRSNQTDKRVDELKNDIDTTKKETEISFIQLFAHKNKVTGAVVVIAFFLSIIGLKEYNII